MTLSNQEISQFCGEVILATERPEVSIHDDAPELRRRASLISASIYSGDILNQREVNDLMETFAAMIFAIEKQEQESNYGVTTHLVNMKDSIPFILDEMTRQLRLRARVIIETRARNCDYFRFEIKKFENRDGTFSYRLKVDEKSATHHVLQPFSLSGKEKIDDNRDVEVTSIFHGGQMQYFFTLEDLTMNDLKFFTEKFISRFQKWQTSS